MNSSRNQTKPLIHTPGQLGYPDAGGVSLIAVRGKAHDALWAKSRPSELDSLTNCDRRITETHDLRDYPGLSDELGAYLPANRQSRDPSAKKLIREYSVFARMANYPETRARLLGGEAIDLVNDIQAQLGTGMEGFRNSPMSMAPDAKGVRLLLPDAGLCRPLMQQLAPFLSVNILSSPSIAAMVALVAVMHAHPFRDGNGRTARILYNLIMRIGTGGGHYLPLSSFQRLERGTFAIKLRRAMYDGNWDQMQHFLLDATRLSISLQSADPAGS